MILIDILPLYTNHYQQNYQSLKHIRLVLSGCEAKVYFCFYVLTV